MVRPSRRKGIEEVYGSKLEALQPCRPQTIPQPNMTKTATMRVASSRQTDPRTQRSYVTANDYYITTNVPLNATNMRTANSSIGAHPSKTAQMPVQMQVASTQAMSYGSLSNRRSKPSARQPIQSQPQKVHFVASDNNKGHGHMLPHGHNHSHAKAMPMQLSQRNVYAQNMEMEPNVGDLTDKDVMISTSNLNTRRPHTHSHQNQPHPHPHPHPLQHQLHQQQQLNNPINTNSSNMHHMQQQQQQHNLNQKHAHQYLQQQHHQQQQQQQHQQHQQHQQQQQRPHQRQSHAQQQQLSAVVEEEEKEDDPEEFFELIRQTVKTAVGTTICDVVSRNFLDLSSKMERFSNELKVTNDLFCKLHDEVTNKVMHYGEENTRHFRYLCMKSEYDKMFYQHQTMISGKHSSSKVTAASQANLIPAAVPTRVAKQSAALNQKSVKQQMAAGKLGQGSLKKLTRECVKPQNPCACRSTSKSPPQQQMEEQQSSSDQSVNVKSSELGVREVLGQIQRFCTQMQLNDLKDEQPKYNSMTGISTIEMSNKTSSGSGTGTIAGEPTGNEVKGNTHITLATAEGDALDAEIETPVDSMDEIEIDNFQYSSDEMSSYSDDSDVKFSGTTTARAPLQSSRPKQPIQHSNKGAGDGQ